MRKQYIGWNLICHLKFLNAFLKGHSMFVIATGLVAGQASGTMWHFSRDVKWGRRHIASRCKDRLSIPVWLSCLFNYNNKTVLWLIQPYLILTWCERRQLALKCMLNTSEDVACIVELFCATLIHGFVCNSNPLGSLNGVEGKHSFGPAKLDTSKYTKTKL